MTALNGTIVLDVSNFLDGLVYIEIPVKNFPIFPKGTNLYIKEESGEFYLEDLRIESYEVDSDSGVRISCSAESNIPILIENALQFCSKTVHDELDATYTYKRTVDFGKIITNGST